MKTGFKTIDSLDNKYLNRIDSFSDETNTGEGYWIGLKKEFRIGDDNSCGLIHADNVLEAAKELKKSKHITKFK